MNFLVILLLLAVCISMPSAFAAQSITDRIEIDADNIPLDIAAGDMFGYVIESIGDLDGDGVTDLATIKFQDNNSGEDNVGSILILFMNLDGSVKGTNEIIMDASSSGIGASCIVGDSTNRDPFALEQLAFVGDLNGNGQPTLALGAPRHDHDSKPDSGAVYMLELHTNISAAIAGTVAGTVDNCLRIIPGENGFAPANNQYLETDDAYLGWPLIVTDLNSDGQNELIVGASNEANTSTNLWVLFLTTTGTVSSHPATPILGTTDIGITGGLFIDDGNTISGGTKIAVGVKDEGTTGSIFIVTLKDGTFSSSAEITGTSLDQGIAGTDDFGRGIAGIGDMDGNGIDDIIVGNIAGDDTNGNSGEAYILFMNSDDTVKESQKISNESEDARTGSTPFADSDMLGNGMTLWQTSGNTVTIAIGAHEDGAGVGAIHLFYITKATTDITDIKSNGGGGCSGDCTNPTFYKNKNGLPIVKDGFIFDNYPSDVTDYNTEYPLIVVNTNQTYNLKLKNYDNGGLDYFQIGFGMPEAGKPFNDAESLAVFYINHTKGLDRVEHVDKNNLIDIHNATVNMVPCGYTVQECYELSLYFSARDQLKNNVMGIQAVDKAARDVSNFMNDGIEFVGETINEPLISHVPAFKGGAFYPQDRGLVELTLISYKDDLWQDPYGHLWTSDNHKSFKILSDIPVPIKEPDLKWAAMTRMNSNFDAMKQTEIERAQVIIDKIFGTH